MLTRRKRGILIKKCYLSLLTDHIVAEPYNYRQALKDPVWKQAMQEEYDALMQQHTWTLVPLPPSKNVVSCKWILKVKELQMGALQGIRLDL